MAAGRRRKAGLVIAVSTFVVALGVPEVWLRVQTSRPKGDTLQEHLRGVELPEPGTDSRWLHALRPVENERLAYTLRPNFDAYVTIAGRRVRMTINEHGFRGPPCSVAKPPGTVRIVGIGDSVMMGYALEHEETYLHLLERMLAEQYPEVRVEVLNLAVGGYNAVQELETLRNLGLALQPDLVLWHIVSNDHHGIQYRAWRANPWDLTRWFLLEALIDRADPANTGRYRGWRHVERSFAELRRLRDEHGFSLLVYSHEASEPTVTLRDTAREQGHDVVDLGEFLPAHRDRLVIGGDDLLIPGDGHPSALHNELMAQDLFELIQSRGLLARALPQPQR